MNQQMQVKYSVYRSFTLVSSYSDMSIALPCRESGADSSPIRTIVSESTALGSTQPQCVPDNLRGIVCEAAFARKGTGQATSLCHGLEYTTA